jgi:signal transduction histidine kinase
MTRPIRRIAVASGLAVILIGVALAATVWSYRNAAGAHSAILGTVKEQSASHAAETYLVREREAMNEYLLDPSRTTLAEISAMKAGFDDSMSLVGIGDADEAPYIEGAGAANDEFLKTFERRGAKGVTTVAAFRLFESQLSDGEKAVLAPLQVLRLLNQRQAVRVQRRADAANSHALVAAILAGVLAIAGGLGFALYAVRLVREIDSRNEQLRQLDRVKDDFVASVSHELRTPLTSIRGYLELVLDGEAGDLTEEQHQFLGIVDRNADRLLRVVGDLLFVAQVDAGKITIERAPTDVDELVREAVEAARPTATEQGVELELEVDGLGPLHADRARLAQVVDNLISNAVKFTPFGGRVEVRSAREGDLAVLEVADTGIGISPEDQDQLFQRFFRTEEATKRAIQGTGLGLSIAQAIVEAHYGTISVTSVPGAGTTFRVELPLARERVTA